MKINGYEIYENTYGCNDGIRYPYSYWSEANDLIPTTFHHSSAPILYSQPSQVDNKQGLLHNCLSKKIEDCLQMLHEVDTDLLSDCIVDC